MAQEIDPSMTVFEIRDALRANGGNQVVRMNFNDAPEDDVTVVAVSGPVAKLFRQMMDTFTNGGELRIGSRPSPGSA